MPISDYTSYDDIRAALGVNEDELKDATISLEIYESNLTAELEDIGFDLPADYGTVAALSSRTAVQERFYRVARLFATYAVAKQLLAGLSLFAPKEVTDGKAGVTRFALDPYKKTIELVNLQYDSYKQRLETAYAANASTTASNVTRVWFTSSSPTSDPVTGS